MLSRTIIVVVLLTQGACAPNRPANLSPAVLPVGVLVMAHGGGADWNQSVERAIAPLRSRAPTALAFGMADPSTLAAGLDSLREQGVRRVAVVRLFVSGESFLARTAQLLHLDLGVHDSTMTLEPIDHGLEVATHFDGVADWNGLSTLITQRVTDVQDERYHTSVLLLAHGQGTEEHNRKLQKRMQHSVEALQAHGVGHVRAVTLREDWPDLRRAAEAEARTFVAERSAAGDTVIVVPFRLSGFGPYARVLDGLRYIATPGFLPHPAIAGWVEQTAAKIVCGNAWRTDAFPCPHVTVPKVPLPR